MIVNHFTFHLKMANNSTNDRLSRQLFEHKKKDHDKVWDRHKNVAELDWLMGAQTTS